MTGYAQGSINVGPGKTKSEIETVEDMRQEGKIYKLQTVFSSI